MIQKFKHWLLMLLINDIIRNLAGKRGAVPLDGIRTRAQVDWLSRTAWGLRAEDLNEMDHI